MKIKYTTEEKKAEKFLREPPRRKQRPYTQHKGQSYTALFSSSCAAVLSPEAKYVGYGEQATRKLDTSSI